MAKYVCDFAEVIAAGEQLCSAANNIKTAIQNYDTNVTNDLSAWSGEAKNNFTTQCTSRVKLATEKAEKINEVGEFMMGVNKKGQGRSFQFTPIAAGDWSQQNKGSKFFNISV